tara:strand:+ start:380 stop:559 length:180 start_codon:yes stop_codon:yes gene_type:complete
MLDKIEIEELQEALDLLANFTGRNVNLNNISFILEEVFHELDNKDREIYELESQVCELS